MLESSVFFENSVGVAEEGASGCNGGEESAGSRLPPVAMVKIRSNMDVAFRDSGHKASLWNEVSRKLPQMGYHRSSLNCHEEFDNMFNYHRRHKDQLDLLGSHFSHPSTSLNQVSSYSFERVPTLSNNLMTSIPGQDLCSFPCTTREGFVDFMSASTSSASSSDNESEGGVEKKRRVTDYFEKLMKQVLEKQEELQKKFLETIEKCEKEWIAREEAWKVQEMERIKREKEILAKERAMSVAKDAAMLSFLQHLTQITTPVKTPDMLTTLSDKPPGNLLKALENHSELPDGGVGESSSARVDGQENSAGESRVMMSCSRWPKAEIEALVMVKTDLDFKYHDTGPKGPLWEEVSSSMKMLGYHRTAKRCKEKWENINKYYKRVKNSNKRRAEDSKTCPYFNLLDSLYAKKSI